MVTTKTKTTKASQDDEEQSQLTHTLAFYLLLVVLDMAQLRETIDEELVVSLIIRSFFTNITVRFELEMKTSHSLRIE